MKQALKQLVRKAGLEWPHLQATLLFGALQALALAPRSLASRRGCILYVHSVGQPKFDRWEERRWTH